MSGGSYNYLCFADESDIGRKLDELAAMSRRLDNIAPESYAATDTEEVLTIVAALGFALRRLSDVWRAVEWCDSGDWGDDTMNAAIAEYQARRATEEAEHA